MITIMVLVLGLAAAAREVFPDPTNLPEPIAVIFHEGCWGGGFPARHPRIVVYEDGSYIKGVRWPDQLGAEGGELNRVELKRLKKLIGDLQNCQGLEPAYDLAPTVCDLVYTRLFVRQGDRSTTVTIYGISPNRKWLPVWNMDDFDIGADRLPRQLAALYQALYAIEPMEESWRQPPWTELRLIKDWSQNDPVPEFQWPEDWPRPRSLHAVDIAYRRERQVRAIMDNSDVPILRARLNMMPHDGQRVLASDSQWRLEWHWPAYPHEEMWREAFGTAPTASAAREESPFPQVPRASTRACPRPGG
ncbi:hypothetical protein KQI84_17085 [bacterium]|nr:hypothetical protein [bacterium]